MSRLDPAFLSSGSDSLRYDLIDQPRTPSPRRSDTPWWPKAAATLALFIGVGAGVATLVRALGATPVAETPAPQTTTAAAQPEPTQQQPSPPPVAPPAEQVEEAAPAEERPAAPVVRTASNRKLPPPRYEQVSVITRPEGGNLYVGGSYSGPDGTHLRRRWGSRLEVACKMPGFRDGNVTVRFDGKTAVYLCRLRPRQRAAARRKPAVVDGCVEGLKNPFKECN